MFICVLHRKCALDHFFLSYISLYVLCFLRHQRQWSTMYYHGWREPNFFLDWVRETRKGEKEGLWPGSITLRANWPTYQTELRKRRLRWIVCAALSSTQSEALAPGFGSLCSNTPGLPERGITFWIEIYLKNSW